MNAETLSDVALRARAGDASALEALVSGLQGPTYRVALRFLGEPDAARDATQEILILVITRLATFRGESAVTTWAYSIAVRYLLRARRRGRRWTFESLAEEDLGRPPNAVEASTLLAADEKLLEEEVFIGCTQVMLQALDADLRIAFILGGICELESPEAAEIVGISAPAFRKRLSRARGTLDAFVADHCGVANPQNACRCRFQINYNVARGALNPAHLRFASPAARSGGDAARVLGEIHGVRRRWSCTGRSRSSSLRARSSKGSGACSPRRARPPARVDGGSIRTSRRSPRSANPRAMVVARGPKNHFAPKVVFVGG